MRYVKHGFSTRKKSKKHKSHRNALHKVVLSMLLLLEEHLENGNSQIIKTYRKSE